MKSPEGLVSPGRRDVAETGLSSGFLTSAWGLLPAPGAALLPARTDVVSLDSKPTEGTGRIFLGDDLPYGSYHGLWVGLFQGTLELLPVRQAWSLKIYSPWALENLPRLLCHSSVSVVSQPPGQRWVFWIILESFLQV